MTQNDYTRKLDELDRLLNDPDVQMDPARVWSLLADLAGRDACLAAHRGAYAFPDTMAGAAD
jgi:hypothetical protein